MIMSTDRNSRSTVISVMEKHPVSLLDYGAGNVRSLRNAITALGYDTVDIVTPQDIEQAQMIIFPGVGNFGQAILSLREKAWFEPLRKYLLANRPFFGICLGMQSLFEGSDESSAEEGLGIIPGRVTHFSTEPAPGLRVRVPHIGWNGVSAVKSTPIAAALEPSDAVYFVHSYCALPMEAALDWTLGVTDYGGQRFVSMVQRGNVTAVQFHPEKSGAVGLRVLQAFLSQRGRVAPTMSLPAEPALSLARIIDTKLVPGTRLAKRVVACLDVRSNDQGDLVVTKGDQYDVREAPTGGPDSDAKGIMRNLGKPVDLCGRYYEGGADEVVFLNIISFRREAADDLPLLAVLERASQRVFVPLCVGGGIRPYTDVAGIAHSALEVATKYFRSGADKVSLGSDAVYAAEEFLAAGCKPCGTSSVEIISQHYGAQAVVVSIDPRRVYITSDEVSACRAAGRVVSALEAESDRGPKGETLCWWRATVKGGREDRDICAVTVARVCAELGAGEIMLNSIDRDGQNSGYDIPLILAVQQHVTIPVIASSGAGCPAHFEEVFRSTDVQAALAAGIFHRGEVSIAEVKAHLEAQNIPIRRIVID